MVEFDEFGKQLPTDHLKEIHEETRQMSWHLEKVKERLNDPVRSQYSSSLISLGFSALPSFSIRG